MALTNSDKKEIGVLVRKEIKDFIGKNSIKQLEDNLIDTIKKDISRGKIKGDIQDIVTKMMVEFYRTMWTKRSFWEKTIKR